MAQLVVMYKTPTDKTAFDKHYFEKHIPLAKTIPGLRRYEVNQGPIMTPAGPSNFYLIATLHFDDMAAIQAAFATPQSQAARADVQGFATGGVEMYIYENKDV